MARQVGSAAWLFGVGVIAAGLLWAAQQLTAQDDIPRYLRQLEPAADRTAAEPPANSEPSAAQRLREGLTLTNVVGSFQAAGERIAFHPDNGHGPFLVLENLMRERVERLRAGTGDRSWVVSGVLTEYGGHNFLLLQRAVVGGDNTENAPVAPGVTAERS